MTLTRRDLFRTSAMAAAGSLANLELNAAPARMPKTHFMVHPFIEAHPKAIFIKRTKVPEKMDEQSKLREGVSFAREVFVPTEGPDGIPISHTVILKPNFTSVRNQRPHVENWGTGTYPQFY